MSIDNLGQATGAVAGILESNGSIAEQVNTSLETFGTMVDQMVAVKAWLDDQVALWSDKEMFQEMVGILQAASGECEVAQGTLGHTMLSLQEVLSTLAANGMQLEEFQTALERCR